MEKANLWKLNPKLTDKKKFKKVILYLGTRLAYVFTATGSRFLLETASIPICITTVT